jgi:anti-sigma-K factor RskA
MQDRGIHIEHDTLAAYAVDALTREEIVAIGGHLQACAQCQQEVASLRATVGLLPYGLVEAEPPASLRDRIISAARNERATLREQTAPGRKHATRPNWFRRLAPALVAFTFIAGLLLGRAWPASGPGVQPQPEGQVATLTGEGSGTFLVADDRSYVRLTVTGLPPLEPGRVYQLWLLGRSVPISAGTFTGDAGGSGQLEINGLAWSPEYTGIAITIEPLGGNAAPTSDIVAQAEL